MKKYRLFSAISLVATLLLSACSQEELGEQGMALPEGEYPLQIGSVTLTAEVSEQPWTRVSENPADGMSSVWTHDDKIGVRIGDDEETGIYVVKLDAEGTVMEVVPEKPVYWKDKQPAIITAWYPVKEELDFTHQDQGLTYLLKGTSTVNADYKTSANLTFSHQLAKVRVKLEGAKANEVTAVTVRSYPKATHNQGTNVTKEGDAAYYPMWKATYNGETYWEANLLDGHLEAANTFRVSSDDKNFVHVKLTKDVNIDPGYVHTINISVYEPQNVTGNIDDSDTYIVSGERNEPINITGGSPTIYLDEANITANSGNTINITGGNPTNYIVGQNTITSSSGTGIYVAKGCSVTIISDDRVSNALTVTGKITGIGGSANEDEVLDCGDITIRYVTLSASTSDEKIYVNYETVHRPSIGAVGTAACGTITIDNSTVTAYGSGDDSNRSAAAIGGGLVGTSIGEKISISISNSDIYAHRNCSVGNYIGQGGHLHSAQKGQIDADVKNSTIHKYTSDTYDGQTVYGDDGSIIE